VNEQELPYWVDVFSKHGFTYRKDITEQVVSKSTMRQKKGSSFMRRAGMFFIKDGLHEA